MTSRQPRPPRRRRRPRRSADQPSRLPGGPGWPAGLIHRSGRQKRKTKDRHEGASTALLRSAPTAGRGPRTAGDRAGRRDCQARRRWAVPHRPAHHRWLASRCHPGRTAARAGPRERRLDPRDRPGGRAAGGRRPCHLPPQPHLRDVPRLPGRGRHAVHSRPSPARRHRHGRHGRAVQDQRAGHRQAGRRHRASRSGRAGRCRADRLPRRPQSRPGTGTRHLRRGGRRRRARPHRNPVPQGDDGGAGYCRGHQ